MKAPLRLKNHFKEQNLYVNRVIILFCIGLLLFTALLVRLGYLQIVHHQRFESKSRNNLLRVESLAPSRGIIYDRTGQILAQNLTTFQLEIIPEEVKNIEAMLTTISGLISLSPKEMKSFKRRLKNYPKYASIPLKFKLTEQESAIISVNLYKFQGVYLKPGLLRHYPQGATLAHVLGYVGRINENDLKNIDKARYSGTHFIGKAGIEKQYEALLQGYPGLQEIQTNAYGRGVRALDKTPSKPGIDISLTLDLKLQQLVTKAMQGKKGAVVAVSPNDGEILALISAPNFDPNMFVTGISDKDQALLVAQSKPLFNRFLKGQYPPASTLKPIMSLAGLHYHTVTPSTTINDPGWYQLNEKSRKIRDWQPYGHGKTNMVKAIRESCDTYYYDLAFKLGIDKISSWLKAVGFGKKTGIDLPGEREGLVPSKQWKLQTKDDSWYHGETLITGIGQGYLSSTPLQLAQSVALIANRGYIPKLHLIKGKVSGFEPNEPLEVNPSFWNPVIKGMEQAVKHPGGTAYKVFKDVPYRVAGKTGTAQVFGMQKEKIAQHLIPEHLRDHSLFIGFAPIDEPKIAVAVIIENNKGSADIARQIFDYVLEPQT